MEEHVIVNSSFSPSSPRRSSNRIPSWCFSLPDDGYIKAVYPVISPPGRPPHLTTGRTSINGEVIGGTPMVQHYAEQVAAHQFTLTVCRRCAD